MQLSLTITSEDADTISHLAALAAVLGAYYDYNKSMDGDYSTAAFSSDRVNDAVSAVIEAAGDLFRNHGELVWGIYDDLSPGLLGRSLISLGKYLTEHPRFIVAYEKMQRDLAEFNAARPELAEQPEPPALD